MQRGLTKIWKLPSATSSGDGDLVNRILATRGVHDAATAASYLDPSLRDLAEPSLMPDLDRAAERLLGALKAQEPLVIYGDYDVDGISATAILYHTLKAIRPSADVRTYVPHRIDEGYGLNSEALVRMAAEGVKVVVSVDCGITANGPADAAAKAGLDLIITDHHNPPRTLEDLPRAYAVVHPRRPDSGYPFGWLCGAGVAYKLAWRLATMHCGSARVAGEMRTLLVELLAFAALGSVADAVPLVGENRVIAKFGLSRIKHSPIQGLRALVHACGLGGDEIDAEHVGYWLGPRLNACGRLGHAREAVELLTTAAGAQAAEISQKLSTLNEQRKVMERSITEEAASLAESQGMTDPGRRAIVVAHEGWHGGVLGICCSRLVDRFCRPTILMRRSGDECAGSGRSVDGFNLHAALEACSRHLKSFGGHDMAAGVRVETSKLPAFVEAFTEVSNASIPPDRLLPSLLIDAEATVGEFTGEAVRTIEKMAPFGSGNPRPKVMISGVSLAARAEPFGRAGKHLALHVRENGRSVRIVGWGWGEHWERLPAGVLIDAVVTPKISAWNGLVEPELHDLRPATPAAGAARPL